MIFSLNSNFRHFYFLQKISKFSNFPVKEISEKIILIFRTLFSKKLKTYEKGYILEMSVLTWGQNQHRKMLRAEGLEKCKSRDMTPCVKRNTPVLLVSTFGTSNEIQIRMLHFKNQLKSSPGERTRTNFAKSFLVIGMRCRTVGR